jgi:hypothetical protein
VGGDDFCCAHLSRLILPLVLAASGAIPAQFGSTRARFSPLRSPWGGGWGYLSRGG